MPVGLVHEVLRARPKTAELAQRYDEFALRSFVEDNRSLVWCTGGAWQVLLTTLSSPGRLLCWVAAAPGATGAMLDSELLKV